MFALERQESIARSVEESGRVYVDALSRRFRVSAVTIRKDLRLLEERHRLIRTHGGAVAARSDLLDLVRESRQQLYPAKERLVRASARAREAIKAADSEPTSSITPVDRSTRFVVAFDKHRLSKRRTNQMLSSRGGANSETVHRENLSTLLRRLHLGGPLTRSKLVDLTGLSRSAVGDLVGELGAAGLVAESRAGPQGVAGRPSPLVSPHPGGAAVLVIEIVVDSIGLALIGLGGHVLERARIAIPPGRLAPDDIGDLLAHRAAPLLAGESAQDRVIAVGIAVAGIVRTEDGLVHLAPNLGWTDVPLAAIARKSLGLNVPVFVGNEADLGAVAEHLRGAGRGVDDLVYISGEVGVGGGIITGGRPMSGAAGYAGELGHMVVNPSGRICRCGSRGCWETEVGERALLAHAGRPDADAGRDAVDRLIKDAESGSPAALRAIATVGDWLGLGIAGLVNIFNPRRVILGDLFARLFPFVGDAIRAEVSSRALAMSGELVEVVPALLGEDAPLLGAAELAFEPLLADPLRWAPLIRDADAKPA